MENCSGENVMERLCEKFVANKKYAPICWKMVVIWSKRLLSYVNNLQYTYHRHTNGRKRITVTITTKEIIVSRNTVPPRFFNESNEQNKQRGKRTLAPFNYLQLKHKIENKIQTKPNTN